MAARIGSTALRRAALAALCAGALGGSAVASAAEEFFDVILLGTGSPRPAPDRNGPSTYVSAGGVRMVFDMGRGTAVSLFRAGIPLGSIDVHFLTHLHSDHVNGLPDLYLTGWIGVPYGNRTKPFRLYGPPGTEALTKNLYAAFAEDRRIRTADEGYPAAGIAFDAHDVPPGPVLEQSGVKVSTFAVFHGPLIEPAYGYRIEYRGHVVVLSGDTKYAASVEKAATGSDLLVHEVAAVSGDVAAVLASSASYRAILDHHTDPATAGMLFAKARPKLAVFSHIVTPSNPPADAVEILRQTRTTYDGPVVVGADMMRFKVTDAGVEQVSPK